MYATHAPTRPASFRAGTTTLTVTSASGTTAGNYSVDASVGSSVGSAIAGRTGRTAIQVDGGLVRGLL